MFQDEAGFGRINRPKNCWCKKGIRPSVPCHHIREYRYVYGAVEPKTGESCFLIMPSCNTDCMNAFLKHLSNSYPNDQILLVCDGAAWHKSKSMIIPKNIHIIFIPPYTPEMNPIEQIWRELRIINILGNAVKFTPEGGSVRFLIEEGSRFNRNAVLKFIISDTGIGMSKDFLPHIFDPFSQEDGTSTSKYGSTGLGMPITKSIVELMNGHIDVVSEKGKGTTFTVTLTLGESDRKQQIDE
ncbi:MAG: IS630 family transposase, partial [Clostridia bacterium]|nr:IS630 family transposase [Clostridia bacterium]